MNAAHERWLLAVVFATVGFGVGLGVLRLLAAKHVERRLDRSETVGAATNDLRPRQSMSRWLRVAVLALVWGALAVGCALALRAASVPSAIAIALTALVNAFSYLGWEWRTSARRNRSEAELANALDLMVAALRTGAPLHAALEFALQATRNPLREALRGILGRMRLGESPDLALRRAAAELNFESMQLFVVTVQAHWRSGGSLAPALSRSAVSIRDKVEVGRRIAGEASQARLSVLALFGIVYAVAWIIWRQEPERVETFLKSSIGSFAAALCIGMQAAGVLWMQRLTRVVY